MIVKYIILLFILLLFIMILSTINYMRWNRLLHKRQFQLDGILKVRVGYTWRFSIMLILLVSIVAIRMNATTIYLSVYGYHTSSDCAYNVDDTETLLDYNEDVFIVTIESIDGIKQFDILNNDHSPLNDTYYYQFNLLETLRGTTEDTTRLTQHVQIEHPMIKISDACNQGTPLKVGETYLIIGGYLSALDAKKNTDPRSKEGNWYYISQAHLLENYDKHKPIHQQSLEIETFLDEYQQYIQTGN